jgi:hypothetical protein
MRHVTAQDVTRPLPDILELRDLCRSIAVSEAIFLAQA